MLKSRLTGTLARNTGWMFIGQGLRVAIQAMYFVVIARTLGVAQYGAFVGAAAFVAILAPFASLGSGNVLVRSVARSPDEFAWYWGAALRTTRLSGLALGAISCLSARAALPATVPSLLILELIVSDIYFARLVDTAGQAFQAFHRLRETAATQFLLSFLRLAGAVALWTWRNDATATEWGALYLFASAVTAVVCVRLVGRRLGNPDRSARLSRQELRDGFLFSVTNSAATVYNDIDKTMLASLAGLKAAGFYGAAYRILDVSFVPIRSILFAAYARFFIAGQTGIPGALAFAKRLLPVALIYSGIASCALFALAPMLPRVIGQQYATSVVVLRALAVLPVLRAFHYFAADLLTGADFQGVRSGVQTGIAAGNVALNLWLIPQFSWRGAVWSTLACDGALAVALWTAVIYLTSRTRTAPAHSGSSTAQRNETAAEPL